MLVRNTICGLLVACLSSAVAASPLWLAQAPKAQPAKKAKDDAVFKKTHGDEIGLQIMGMIVQKDAADNVALIKEESGKVMAVKRNHVVLNKRYKVVNIMPKYIHIINKKGEHFHVYRDKFAGGDDQPAVAARGPSVDPTQEYYKEDGFERKKNEITMTAMYRDKIVKDDLAKILMQATAEPVQKNGAIIGFKIYQIDDDSIFAKGGLQNNDVITSINGKDLNSVAGAISTLRSLKGADSLQVDLLRSDAPQTITITVN